MSEDPPWVRLSAQYNGPRTIRATHAAGDFPIPRYYDIETARSSTWTVTASGWEKGLLVDHDATAIRGIVAADVTADLPPLAAESE